MRTLSLILLTAGLMLAPHGPAAASAPARRPAAAAAPVGIDEHALAENLAAAAMASFDSARGGFVSKKGEPNDAAVELGFALDSEGGPKWAQRSFATIQWMRALRDSVGGGYFTGAHEASPQAQWFEKRTDLNARRLEGLISAWHRSGDGAYAGDAARQADFFDRVLLDGRGGFAAGQGGGRDFEPGANGYAIHAWLTWSAATGKRRDRDFALKSVDRVWTTCWSPEFGLLRRDPFGNLQSAPLLGDQVEMGRALVLAVHLAGRRADRVRAKALGDLLLRLYEDRSDGGFLTKVVPKKNGKIAKAQRIPVENARAARFLCELAHQTGDDRYLEAARRVWRAFGKDLARPGDDAAEWALSVRASFDHEMPMWANREEPEPEPPPPSVIRIRRSR